LEEYPEDQQHLKEVQLEANLREAAEEVAAEAAKVLEIQPCSPNNEAKPLPSFSWASLFDLLL
jgi:CRISPR/Cas system-associated exonuclease Cas4 (RecB family)